MNLGQRFRKELREVRWRKLLPIATIMGVLIGASIGGFQIWYEFLYVPRRCAPVRVAMNEGNPTKLAALIEKEPQLINVKDLGGETPLHWAIGYSNTADIMTVLLDHGARLDAQTKSGFTPLHKAAEGNDPNALKFLLAHGADWRIRDYEGLTALDWAAFRGYTDIARLLIDKGAEPDIYSASALDQSDRVLAFLKADPALINSRLGRFGTPLQIAVRRGQTNVAEALLRNGAELDGNGYTRSTLLQEAHEARHDGMILFLLDHRADPNVLGSASGLTLLHFAALEGRTNVVEALIAHGANVNARDQDGRTPLGLALKFHQPEVADLLRQHGAIE